MNQSSHTRVLVIGAGLIGTSIALALKAQGRDVFLADSDAEALHTGLVKSGATSWTEQATVDLIVVATPPSSVADVMRSAAHQHPNAVVTDVASVKGAIFAALNGEPESVLSRIVGGHPMAGREVSGARAAQSNLFVDRPWVITRTAHTSDAACAAVYELATALGAVPIERSIEEHDEAVALISHTPQVLASVLAGRLVDAPQSQVDLAGQGIRDTIRIAGSDANLWSDILASNAHEVSRQVTAIASRLAEVAEALDKGDKQAVVDILTLGSTGQKKLPGKHGERIQEDAVVVVRLDDKPGELARLFAVAAQADVNLEDVRIDHSLGRMTGLVELTVAQSVASKLEHSLIAQGFVVIV
jgi:prephenate dehydrogenase